MVRICFGSGREECEKHITYYYASVSHDQRTTQSHQPTNLESVGKAKRALLAPSILAQVRELFHPPGKGQGIRWASTNVSCPVEWKSRIAVSNQINGQVLVSVISNSQ